MLDRSRPPRQYAVSKVDFQHVITEKLDPGITFHFLESGDQPVVKLEALFPKGGAWFEQKRGVALLCLTMLREGTRSYSSKQISGTLAAHGAFLDINPGLDYTSIALYCLDRHLEKLLPLFVEMIDSPSFEEGELNLQKDQQVAQLQVRNKKNNIVASKRLRSILFGDTHPYGRILDENDIRAISADDLQAFHRENMKGDLQLFLSGAPSAQSIAALKSSFNSWTLEHRMIQKRDLPPTATQNNGNHESVQASIRIGKVTLEKTHTDYVPLLITNHLLGGYFGSRLMKNIREDKGLTYGISSSVIPLKNASYWALGAEVNVKLLDQALNETKKEVRSLAEFNDINELETAKTQLMGSFQSEINSPFQLLEKFKNVHLHGMDYDYYNRYFSALQQFNCENVREISQKYLSTEDWTEVVVY
ncbi:MAG: insulinase family protein [Cytophagales bacterium]|nr:insulinase family protein [Cytophagales bacterium]